MLELFLVGVDLVLFGEGGLAGGAPGCDEELLLLGVLGSNESLFIPRDVATWFGEGRSPVVLRVLSLSALELCCARVFDIMLPELATALLAILNRGCCSSSSWTSVMAGVRMAKISVVASEKLV